jgi:hypothetical protein
MRQVGDIFIALGKRFSPLLKLGTPLQPDLEGMADVGAEASQRAALGNTAATASAVYALPVMNAVCYTV